MPGPIYWQCRCGHVRATVTTGDGAGLACYCKHCRAYAHHLDAADVLDSAGGTELYQTTPDHVSILAGAQHLGCLSMTPKGPFRWYTTCCHTPFANTAPTRGVPFVGIVTKFAEASGRDRPKISTRVYTEGATGRLPGPKGSLYGAMFAILKRALLARLRGAHLQTPFFDAAGVPVADRHVLNAEERARAYSA